jgi:rhodanese-related sulfurtransferase
VVKDLSVEELAARRNAGAAPLVIDVREGWELEVAAIPNVVHIPMNEMPDRVSELDPQTETIVMCRSGARSMRVAQFLESKGFTNVVNLTGGILAWGERIDRNVPSY